MDMKDKLENETERTTVKNGTAEEDHKIMNQVIKEKLLDMETPGFQAEFTPDEADLLGAFEETALTEQDALDSVIDMPLSNVETLK